MDMEMNKLTHTIGQAQYKVKKQSRGGREGGRGKRKRQSQTEILTEWNQMER